MTETLVFSMLRTGLALALAALVVAGVLKITRCRSPWIHRIAWSFVLLQGVLWVRFPIDLPVLAPEPESVVTVSVAEETMATFNFDPEPPISDFFDRTHEAFAERVPVASAPVDSGKAANKPVPAPARFEPGPGFLPLAVWFGGLLFVLLLRSIGYGRVIRCLKSAGPVDGTLPELLQEKKVRLLLTDRFGPAVFHRTILIPSVLWEEASESIRRGILKHELSHVRHHDGLKSFLLSLIAMVHWYNPLAWFALEKFTEAAEWRCDREAFGPEQDGIATFAESMLALNESRPTRLGWVQSYKNQDVKERLRRLKEHHLIAKESVMKQFSVLVLIVALLCVGLVDVNLVAQTTRSKPIRNRIKQIRQIRQTRPVKRVEPPTVPVEKKVESFSKPVETSGFSPEVTLPPLDCFEKGGKFYLKTRVGEIEAAPLSSIAVPDIAESDYRTLSPAYRKIYILGAGLAKPSEEEYRELCPTFSAQYPIGGIRISHLTKDFRADQAKLRPGDVILGFDRWQLSELTHVQLFSKLRSDRDIVMKFWILRGDKLYYVDIPVESMADKAPEDGGFVTDGSSDVSGFTHLVTFMPKGDFNPRNPGRLLSLFRDRIVSEGPITGYFRTKSSDGKLVGTLCTGDPEAFKHFIDSIPELGFVNSERLTKESFEAYIKTKSESLPPLDGGFATGGGSGVSGFTHIVTWGPRGDFKPRSPNDYLRISHAHPDSSKIDRGYFRTKNIDGKLIASNLTSMPDQLRKMIESTPEFEYIKTERLTAESFKEYEKTRQESLPIPPPADGGFATDEGGFTHIAIYGPKGDFVPRTPMDYLSLINPELWKKSVNMGYFRTKITDGKLIAMNLTSDPEKYREVVESIPQFEYIDTERLTKESFEEYEKTRQVSLPPEDGGYATENGFTHLVVFAPEGDFSPKTAKELLDAVSFQKMNEYAAHLGHFRTEPVDGRLIGSFLTSSPERFRKMIESIPNLQYLRSERLTERTFKEYEKRPQMPLLSDTLQKSVDEIRRTDWFQKLDEKQRSRFIGAMMSFPYAFEPAQYEVGQARAEFEKRWVKQLEGPEPGFPGRTQLSTYDEAILGLATIKSDRAVGLLTKIACERVVKDNAHRFFAVRALGMLGDPSVVPELIPLLYHYNTDCRREAQVALVRLTGWNFGGDEKAWGEWYNAHRYQLGGDLPEFDPTPVDWTCGSDDPELKKWADREEQKKKDAR